MIAFRTRERVIPRGGDVVNGTPEEGDVALNEFPSEVIDDILSVLAGGDTSGVGAECGVVHHA